MSRPHMKSYVSSSPCAALRSQLNSEAPRHCRALCSGAVSPNAESHHHSKEEELRGERSLKEA